MARNLRIASVVVDLVANSARYIAELRNANRDTQRYTRQMQRSFSNLSRNIAGMAAGYLGVTAAISQFNKALANAKEMEILSQLAGQSVEEFQAAAYATNQYGISAEKLGDISKDVADKLGDFILTGGGEFKDFFEQVAPKVGLTAQELQGLSGPDVLLRVKKAMDDANVPMTQQVTLLEAISNDTANLIPLLADGGREYHKLGEEAHAANVILSQADISALRESEKVISRVSQQLSTSFAKGVAGAASQIEWLGEVISDALEFWGTQFDSWSSDPRTMEGMIERGADLKEELDHVNASIALLEKNPGSYNGSARLAALNAQAIKLREEIKTLAEKRWDLEGQQAEVEKKLKDRLKNLPGEIKGGNDTGITKTAEEIIKENQRVADSLSRTLLTRKQLLEISYQEEQQQIRDLVLSDEETRRLGFANIDALQKAWLKTSTDNYKKARNEITAETQKQHQQLADSLQQSLSSEQELLKISHEEQKKQIRSLVLTDEQLRALGFEKIEELQKDWLARSKANYDLSFEEMKKRLAEETEVAGEYVRKLADTIGADVEVMANMAENFAYGFSTELANMAMKGEADFGKLAQSIISDILRIAIQARLVEPLMQSMGILPKTAAPKPPVIAGSNATGGPVQRGSTYLVGEKGPELFTASNSGNIIPNHKMGGTTTVNIYTQPGETAETRTRQTEQGDIIEVFMKQVDSRINEQISRGQGLARTLEGRYSLSRKNY